jgi:hypothetical protein
VVLIDFLRVNADIFAWRPSDMPGIPREVAEHYLDILLNSKPVNNACDALTSSSGARSARRCTSFWRPNSSRRYSIPKVLLILY